MAYSSKPSTLRRGAEPVGRPRRRRPPGPPAIFPDLEPANSPSPPKPRFGIPTPEVRLTRASAQDETTDPLLRAEAGSLPARLSVYAMNGALLFMAFPVGMAMLVFNILGGENFRTTAHVVALTGLALALRDANMGPLIGL